jgi:hypothetical protein
MMLMRENAMYAYPTLEPDEITYQEHDGKAGHHADNQDTFPVHPAARPFEFPADEILIIRLVVQVDAVEVCILRPSRVLIGPAMRTGLCFGGDIPSAVGAYKGCLRHSTYTSPVCMRLTVDNIDSLHGQNYSCSVNRFFRSTRRYPAIPRQRIVPTGVKGQCAL